MVAFELRVLGFSVVLGLVHIVAAARAARSERASSRKESVYPPVAPLHGTAGRLARALDNFSETFPLFAALVLAVVVAGKGGLLSQWGAGLYFVARVLYLPLYVFGLPFIRTLVWNVSALGIVLLVVALLLG